MKSGKIKHVAIHGLGLMGGSLGLALGARGMFVTGYARKAETREQALGMAAVAQAFDDPGRAAAQADLVVLCTPVLTIPELAKTIAPSLKAGAIITDVGSTKAWLHQQIDMPNFIGSHPMCGSEKSGLGASQPDLYEGSVTAVTAASVDDPSHAERAAVVADFWETVGSRTIQLTPTEHDALVARTSHLPHLASSLLVAAAHRDHPAHRDDLCGSGYRDMTRLAAGSASVWHDIVKTNAGPVAEELRVLRDELDRVLADIETGDFDAVREFLATQALRTAPKTCRAAKSPTEPRT